MSQISKSTQEALRLPSSMPLRLSKRPCDLMPAHLRTAAEATRKPFSPRAQKPLRSPKRPARSPPSGRRTRRPKPSRQNRKTGQALRQAPPLPANRGRRCVRAPRPRGVQPVATSSTYRRCSRSTSRDHADAASARQPSVPRPRSTGDRRWRTTPTWHRPAAPDRFRRPT